MRNKWSATVTRKIKNAILRHLYLITSYRSVCERHSYNFKGIRSVLCHIDHYHGCPQKVFQGGQRLHFAYPFSGCERCNENWPSQNVLPFLHHKENFPWKHALRSHFFEIVFMWSRIRIWKMLYFLSSFTAFAELGYYPISIFLWTADSWVWIGRERHRTAFTVLT